MLSCWDFARSLPCRICGIRASKCNMLCGTRAAISVVPGWADVFLGDRKTRVLQQCQAILKPKGSTKRMVASKLGWFSKKEGSARVPIIVNEAPAYSRDIRYPAFLRGGFTIKPMANGFIEASQI